MNNQSKEVKRKKQIIVQKERSEWDRYYDTKKRQAPDDIDEYTAYYEYGIGQGFGWMTQLNLFHQ